MKSKESREEEEIDPAVALEMQIAQQTKWLIDGLLYKIIPT